MGCDENCDDPKCDHKEKEIEESTEEKVKDDTEEDKVDTGDDDKEEKSAE